MCYYFLRPDPTSLLLNFCLLLFQTSSYDYQIPSSHCLASHQRSRRPKAATSARCSRRDRGYSLQPQPQNSRHPAKFPQRSRCRVCDQVEGSARGPRQSDGLPRSGHGHETPWAAHVLDHGQTQGESMIEHPPYRVLISWLTFSGLSPLITGRWLGKSSRLLIGWLVSKLTRS